MRTKKRFLYLLLQFIITNNYDRYEIIIYLELEQNRIEIDYALK